MSLFLDHFVEILLSVLAVAFTAWASVVWNMGNRAVDLLNDLKNRLTLIGAELSHTKDRFEKHDSKPWHAHAGEEISSLKARVDALERD